jgi:GAF domain-containing protein/ActR/RegA family two-component response regulator
MLTLATEHIRVLIVDDDPETVRLLTSVFDDSCLVTSTTSIAEARRIVAESWPDVAIIEPRVGAPGDSGLDLLRHISHANDVTRCIMVSASSTAEDAVAAVNAGAAGFLSKPLDVDEVRAKVLRVVNVYRHTLQQRKSLQDLDLIRRVGDVALTLDKDTLLAGLVETVVGGFGADGGAILLARKDGMLVGAVQKGFSLEPIESYVVAPGEGITGLAATTREVQSAEDIATLSIALPGYLVRSGVAAVLAAPLVVPDSVIGVLVLAWRRSRAITPADRNLIGIVAQRAALSLHNAQLYRERLESEERQRYLAEAGQALAASNDEDELLDIVVSRTIPYLGDGCVVFLRRGSEPDLELVRTHHVVPAKARIIHEILRNTPLRVDSEVAGHSLSSLDAFLFLEEDIRRDEQARPVLKEAGMRALMCVPLSSQGRLIGALFIASTESDRVYAEQDLILAREMGLRFGASLANAMLYQEAVEQRRDLQTMFEVARGVLREMDLPVVMDKVTDATMSLLCAEGVCVLPIEKGVPRTDLDACKGMPDGELAGLARLAVERWPDEILRSEQPFFVRDIRVGDYPVSEQAARLNVISMFSTPLNSHNERTGALIAFTRHPAAFPPNTRQLLKTIGAIAGVAIANARSYERERHIAETLQDSLSGVPPVVAGLDIATAYHPAMQGQANIGGDFYDVFRVRDDMYGLVIGDVSGKGLDAAVHWAMVKYTLRAFALDGELEPSLVLGRVNEVVCSLEQQGDVFITLFYGMLDLPSGILRYASAGHDSPFILRNSGDVEYLESTGRALGLLGGAFYDQRAVNLRPGDKLLMYTDGATDARHGNQFLELDGLVRLAAKNAEGSCADLVNGLYNDVVAFSKGGLHDDIALLALRITGEPASPA